MDKSNIFISYRRESGSYLARLLYSAFRDKGYEPFMDIEDLKSGKFNIALLDKIEEAVDFIVVLTPDCLSKCNNDDDWLRQEIRHAIKLGKNIVPVFGKGFQMPHKHELPTDISELINYHGLLPSHNLWDASINKLVKLLQSKPTPKIIDQKSSDISSNSKLLMPYFKNRIKNNSRVKVGIIFMILIILGIIYLKNIDYWNNRNIKEGDRYVAIVDIAYRGSIYGLANDINDKYQSEFSKQLKQLEKDFKIVGVKFPKGGTAYDILNQVKKNLNSKVEEESFYVGLYYAAAIGTYYALKSPKLDSSMVNETKKQLLNYLSHLEKSLTALNILDSLKIKYPGVFFEVFDINNKIEDPNFDLILEYINNQLILSYPE